MKKFYMLLLSSAICSGAFAQGLGLQVGANKLSKNKDLKSTAAAPTCSVDQDTVGIADFDARTSGLSLFGNIGGGYIFGTNELGLGTTPPGVTEVAQAFIVSGDEWAINEAIFYVGAKDQQSSDPSTVELKARVYKMTGSAQGGTDVQNPVTVAGPANSPLGSKTFTLDLVDTVNVWTVVQFDNYIYVNEDFALSLEFASLYAGGDSLGLVTNASGDAGGANLAFLKIPQIGWVEANWAYGNNIDVDVVMFPVSCNEFLGLDSKTFYHGMKLDACAPNPVVDRAEINYALEKYTEDVKLEIFDVTGRVVKEFNEGIKEAGEHKVVLETSNLASGSYYYSLQVDGERLTKKFIITK